MTRDHSYLSNASIDQAAAMARQTLLVRQGVITPTPIASMAIDETFLTESRSALDDSLRRLLRIMTENGDPRGPLRAEAI